MPLSWIAHSTEDASRLMRRAISPPGRVYLMALEARFRIACRSSCGSASTGGRSAGAEQDTGRALSSAGGGTLPHDPPPHAPLAGGRRGTPHPAPAVLEEAHTFVGGPRR